MNANERPVSGESSMDGGSGADATSKHVPMPGAVSGREDAVGRDPLVERYEADGFYFPIPVIGESEAAAQLARVVLVEKAGKLRSRFLRNKAHLAFRFIDELARTPAILDCVERILGPDILLWGSSCFVKAPRSPSYVSWHQDLNYWGLDGTDEVSAWLALSASNEGNGCMRFVPGSHRRGAFMHRDSFAEDNMLSRGQELAVEVDEDEAVPVYLEPGEISLHHGRMFHSSGPNRSDGWRIGLALRYITTSTRQVVGERDFAQLVRGEDRYGHFDALPRPRDDYDVAAMRRFDFVEGVTCPIFFASSYARRDESAASAQDTEADEPDTPAGSQESATPVGEA